MSTITATYPGFQALPKGVKQMLLVSESLFFEEAKVPFKAAAESHEPRDIKPSWDADAQGSPAGAAYAI